MLEERLAAGLGDLRGVRADEKLDDKEVLLVGDAFHWENVFGCSQDSGTCFKNSRYIRYS